jgi:hypothetical protein
MCHCVPPTKTFGGKLRDEAISNDSKGQVALVLILLAAAALIFYAISLNWGRIAQTKAQLTIAADQSASTLASYAASYGEQEKQTNLSDANAQENLSQLTMDFIGLVVAVACLMLAVFTGGATLVILIAVLSVLMAVANIVLQLTVVEPGMTTLWNKLQQQEAIQQQFYETGISVALEGIVGDQVNITDYTDLNTNGVFGANSNGSPLDTIGRFAFFYTDRLKMLNDAYPPNQYVEFFYNELGAFMNNQTCALNATEHAYSAAVPLDPACNPICTQYPTYATCQSLVPSTISCNMYASEASNSYPSILPNPACPADCGPDSTDTACNSIMVPNPLSFQLNDACNNASNPYCNPCCKPPFVLDPLYKSGSPNKTHPTQYKAVRPSYCSIPPDCNPTDPSFSANATDCVPSQCLTNNPYNPYGSYPYIYDPAYQNYTMGISFLDQFGRDQQFSITGEPPFVPMTAQGNANAGTLFPNGIYPFFWLMKDYSPQVDNNKLQYNNLSPSQVHWCVPGTGSGGNGVEPSSSVAGYTAPDPNTLSAYPDLNQLTDKSSTISSPFQLPYTCSGPDCCVNYLSGSISVSASSPSTAVPITVTGVSSTTMPVTLTSPGGNSFTIADSPITLVATAVETGGTISQVAIYNGSTTPPTLLGTSTSSPYTFMWYPLPGTYNLYAQATDANSNTQNSTTLTITVTDPAPQVTLTAPASGTSITAGTSLTISATITTAGAQISNINFNYSVGTTTGQFPQTQTTATTPGNISMSGNTITLTVNTTNLQAGTYSIWVSATDIYNQSGSSSPVTITITAASTTTGTSTDTSVATSTDTSISTSTGTDTSVSVSTSSSARSAAAGLAAISASRPVAATAAIGASTPTASAAASVITVNITSPTLNQTFTAGYPITITATATDTNGNIAYVEFYETPQGSGTPILLGTVNSANSTNGIYSYIWTNNSGGNYSLTAVAYAYSGGGSSFTIDNVGDPNPVSDPVFGQPPVSISGSPSINVPAGETWQEGDNQFCSRTWPYNGSSSGIPNGQCEWLDSVTSATPANPIPVTSLTFQPGTSTVDALDDVMQTLSRFVIFANSLLSKDVGTLSKSFTQWYPQAAAWIAPKCTTDPTCPNSDGTLLSIYDPYTTPPIDRFKDWNTAISNWLGNNYTPASGPYSWCVPPESDPSLNVNGSPTAENTYISTLGNTVPSSSSWTGDLPHVIACLNYNSGAQGFGSVYNYKQCLSYLTQSSCPTVSSLSGTACDPLTLGRSLDGTTPVVPWANNDKYRCNISYTNANGNPSMAKWVSDSYTLANDEAPKFALRAQFLNDIYSRAQTMQKIFTQADVALQTFLKPCGTAASDPTCANGGPAAQLVYARSKGDPSVGFPNAVIYGWQDSPLGGSHGACVDDSGNSVGCSHIVKVTAYAPQRQGNGAVLGDYAPFVQNTLPNVSKRPNKLDIDATLIFGIPVIYEVYELLQRDGYVYVAVKRWDQDHSNPITFPNKHQLWQFLFHHPKGNSTTGSGLWQSCIDLSTTNTGTTIPQDSTTPNIGFGLLPQTVAGLNYAMSLPGGQNDNTTLPALAQAFMLNDRGDGRLDINANTPGKTCGTNETPYCSCLSVANHLLDSAPESQACAEYVATQRPDLVASGVSGFGDQDYSIKFVDCKNVPGFFAASPPDDLIYED